MRFSGIVLLLLGLGATSFAGGRINQEGRLLGPAPSVTQPLLFDTPQADAVVAAMQIMPVTSAWNEDVSHLPLLSNSSAMIAQITSDLDSDRRTLHAFFEMNYVLVPDNQPTQSIHFFNYPHESDLDGGVSPNGLYPIPSLLPIETWPNQTGKLTLAQWQQDIHGDGGDRHAIMVKPGAGFIWETWLTRFTAGAWQASNGAKFDLNSNTLRPAGWTSGDAAGLPMFPALVRYDECERGMVEHAVRLVMKRTRVGPIYPATHQASAGSTTDPNIPAMGQRLRLKASFEIPAGWTKQEKAVCLALKKYGGIVADNGNFMSFSVCPDDRFPNGAFDHLSIIGISNFEVVQSTGPTQGPRSPGAPSAKAGSDQTIPLGTGATLAGSISAPGSTPVVQWKMYSGPGTVTFGNAAQAATTATFSAPGVYVLLLSATDGVHAVAYDAVTINVTHSTPANANLSSLALSAGTLTPAFASGNTNYTAVVGNATSTVNVTPTATSSTATVMVNGMTVAPGAASAAISLALGANTLSVVVTSQDGTTTTTYEVVAFRGVKGDFDQDGQTDLVYWNPTTRATQISYLSGSQPTGNVAGPKLPAGCVLVDVPDLNGNGQPDYLLYNPSTRQTRIWYLNGGAVVTKSNGPTLPAGFSLVAAADFNGDGHPDFVLLNTTTGETAIWYMNRATFVSAVAGPTIPSGYSLAGVADFDADSNPDFLLFDPTTRATTIWYLSGAAFLRNAAGPTISAGFTLDGVRDLNGDGRPDLVLANTTTNRAEFWYMNDDARIGAASGPTPPTGYTPAVP